MGKQLLIYHWKGFWNALWLMIVGVWPHDEPWWIRLALRFCRVREKYEPFGHPHGLTEQVFLVKWKRLLGKSYFLSSSATDL